MSRQTVEHMQSLALELGISAGDRLLLQEICTQLDWEALGLFILSLTRPDAAHSAQQELSRMLQPVEGSTGLGQLAVMLAAACRTREQYRRLGIPDSIYLDTMGCFPRFLKETLLATGHPSFDRAFWCWRQLCGRIFRLGVLEFEYCPEGHPGLSGYPESCSPLLSVHIPSDNHLCSEEVHNSYDQCRRFFNQYGPVICGKGTPVSTVCSSWLLSPELTALLPSTSGIRQFAEDYTILTSDPDNPDFYTWLFHGKNKLQELPVQTSLQRRVKSHLEQGGRVGSACGRLKEANHEE